MPNGYAQLLPPLWLEGIDRARWSRYNKGLLGAAGINKQVKLHRLLAPELKKLGSKPDVRARLTLWTTDSSIAQTWQVNHAHRLSPAPECCFVHNFFGVPASASPELLLQLLSRLRNQSGILARVSVMSWAGLYRFNDQCMQQLVLLLRANPQILSLNLGEKPYVSPSGWRLLQTDLANTSIICAFVDTIDTGAVMICLLKAALKRKRLSSEQDARVCIAAGRLSAACELVPWRVPRVMALIRQPQPGGRARLHLDLAMGKPFWHPTVCWEL